MTPYSRKWFAEMRELANRGILRFTTKQIAKREMEQFTIRTLHAIKAGREMDAYCWATCLAGCAHELMD